MEESPIQPIEPWLALPSHYSFAQESILNAPPRSSSAPLSETQRSRKRNPRSPSNLDIPNSRTTIVYVSEGQEEIPAIPLHHPSPIYPATPSPYVTSIAICTRKTTQKTNRITISSRRAEKASMVTPRPLPTPPLREVVVEPSLRKSEELPRTQGRGLLRLPSIDLGPGLRESMMAGLEGKLTNRTKEKVVRKAASDDTLDDGGDKILAEMDSTPCKILGDSIAPSISVNDNSASAMTNNNHAKPSVRKSRPIISLGTTSAASTNLAQGLSGPPSGALEFQIHAEDVIPAPPPPRTLALNDDIELSKSFSLKNGGAPMEETSKPSVRSRWSFEDVVSPIRERELTEIQSFNVQNSRVSWEASGRRPIKRKPVPSLRVTSLPITVVNKENEPQTERQLPHPKGEHSPDSSDEATNALGDNESSQGSPRGPTSLPDLTGLSITFTDVDGTKSQVDRRLFTPLSNDPLSPMKSPSLSIAPSSPLPPTKPTTDWRVLSFLDLTCTEELALYLRSLVLIHESKANESQYGRDTVESPTSFYSNNLSPIHSSPLSPYSYLPSPSSYNPFTSLPLPTPREPERIADIHLGKLRLSPTTSMYIPLDVVLKKPHTDVTKYTSERQMPCRTTILTNTRRVTFVNGEVAAPGANQEVSLLAGFTAPSPKRSATIGSGRGLLNREDSWRIRSHGGTVLRRRGKDVYLELVELGYLSGAMIAPPWYDVFLNRIDGSVWFVYNLIQSGGITGGVLDTWAFTTLGIPRKGKERVVAVRWADGLDCVHEFRGGNLGNVVAKPAKPGHSRGEMQVKCGVLEMEGVEIYLGDGVVEEEEGWFIPEGFAGEC